MATVREASAALSELRGQGFMDPLKLLALQVRQTTGMTQEEAMEYAKRAKETFSPVYMEARQSISSITQSLMSLPKQVEALSVSITMNATALAANAACTGPAAPAMAGLTQSSLNQVQALRSTYQSTKESLCNCLSKVEALGVADLEIPGLDAVIAAAKLLSTLSILK